MSVVFGNGSNAVKVQARKVGYAYDTLNVLEAYLQIHSGFFSPVLVLERSSRYLHRYHRYTLQYFISEDTSANYLGTLYDIITIVCTSLCTPPCMYIICTYINIVSYY